MLLSVIMVNYNTRELAQAAIQLLLASTDLPNIEIFLIDNASKEDASLLKEEFPQLRFIQNSVNVGFGRANNQALPLLAGDYVLLLNTDAFVADDGVKLSLDYMQQHPRVGILGVKLVGRDGELQPSARYFPTPWNLFLQRSGLSRFFANARLVDDMNWDHASARACDWVPGCYYLVRREVIDQVGLFDPRYFLYYEEVDHCFAAKKAGWEVHYFPGTSVVHIGGESAKSEGELTASGRQLEGLQIESELLFFRKNHGLLGVVFLVCLSTLAELINLLKKTLKGQWSAGFSGCAHRVGLTWGLFFKTRVGAAATR